MRKQSVFDLVAFTEEQLQEIERTYNESLNKQEVNAKLKILIKNFLENLRSSLEFCGQDIYEKAFGSPAGEKIYFPVRQTQTDFENAIKFYFPNLKTVAQPIYDFLESIQPYHPGQDWLKDLVDLTNDNKHIDFTPQTRIEKPELTLSHNGVRFNIGDGKLDIRKGAKVNLGEAMLGDDQVIYSNSTEIRGDPRIKAEKRIWVDFLFVEINKSVLPLLKKFHSEAKSLLNKIYTDFI